MNKKLLFSLSIFTFVGVNAQQNVSFQSALVDRSENFVKQKVDNTIISKAEGDTIWANGFTNPAEWSTATLAGHTGAGGEWTIVSTMPVGLTSQVPPYSFPTAMLSSSGGNFALINSDGAGGGAVQNATVTLVNGVDLSSYGSTAFYLRFKEIFRHYYDKNFVDVSNDGGVTWISFPVNTVAEVPVNSDSGNPSIENVNITAANGGGSWGTNVKIRFRYEGAWDWFWGVDDVQIIEAYANDMKVTAFHMATDSATTLGVDYHFIPVSQVNFPGLTFQADVLNNGAAAQNNAALNATSGTYNETGPTRVIASGAADSLQITVPFMVPMTVGNSIIDLTTTLGVTDADPANNQKTYTVRRDQNLYGRDNGVASGSISNVSSQPDLPLKIGNYMDIFDPMDITSLSIRLVNQPTAVGQNMKGEIYRFDSNAGEFVYYRETENHTITTGDLSTFVKLPMSGGAASLVAGDVVLVMAVHEGGTDEVAFGMAQETQGGSVRGVLSDGTFFQLTSPSAIMIRMSDKDELGINEVTDILGLNVYPNPASDKFNVRFEAQTQSNVVINVTDMAGKVVLSNTMNNVNGVQTVEMNTKGLNAGIYLVNVNANGVNSTKKLTIK